MAMRFLVVDDDQTSRRIIQLFLKPYGESILGASGKEAIDAHLRSLEEKLPFDAIYLDLVMPEMTGIEAVAAIRQNEAAHGIKKKVPIFMLTGETDMSYINMAKAHGVVEYLLKPIQEERLLQGLERLDLISGDT